MTTKIEAYKTNLGLFIHVINGYHLSTQNVRLNGIAGDKFNKIQVQKNSYTNDHWYFLEGIDEITAYEVLRPGKDILTGFILKISSIATDEIPLELSLEDVEQYYDEDTEQYEWKSFSDYRALYKPVLVRAEDVWEQEPIEFTVLRTLTIDSYNEPLKMEVKQDFRGTWVENVKTSDLSSIVTYEDIERLLTPEFLLHERPCSLSSGQVYGIVRHHIKNNIDSKHAVVTSDYDFCFTVKRKIAIKPITTKTEIKKANGRSYSQPKFKASVKQFKEVEIFEMTPADKKYNGYTPISGWQANNLQEMKEQIETYLDALMEEINKQVVECSCCDGTGHIVEKISTNEREFA